MAVVSISRIQVRRGQKNTGSGLPQLASGEFGWAVDTQELYIGNGSVSEGAPFVGNTKLLSETDNLFEFANTYQYKSGTSIQTGDSPNNPVLRTLQARLDDRVSIRSFGAAGDGTNQTVALQRAIDQLYLNASNKGQPQARVELILEPGEYVISSTIFLPPFTTIRGAGADKTIINSGSFVAFQTVNETSVPGSYADDATSTFLNQAREISITGLTINTQSHTALNLVSCKDSKFRDLVLRGNYNLGDTVTGNSNGILLSSLSTAVSSNNNTFDNVVVTQFVTGAKSNNDIKNNIWSNCEFDILWNGFSFGNNTILGTSGMETGPINNTIVSSKFNEIYQHAIQIVNGTDNLSKNNKFYNVGNSGGSSLLTNFAIISFNDLRNSSEGDWFQRSEELGYDEEFKNDVVYYPEVEGPTITDFGTTHKLSINNSEQFSKLFRLPADTVKGYEIDYIYKSNIASATRTGTISLIVDPENDTFNLTDEYDYTGDILYSEQLKFTAQNYDENGDALMDTVAIMMRNQTSNTRLPISGIVLTNPLKIIINTQDENTFPNIGNGQQVLITGINSDVHQLNNKTYYVDNIINTGGTTWNFELYTNKLLTLAVDGTDGITPWTAGGIVSSSDNAVMYYKVKTKS
jgi:hypothetical protein